MKENVIQ